MSTLRLTQSSIFVDDRDLLDVLREASSDFDPGDHNLAIDWASLAATATFSGETTVLFCTGCSAEGFHSGMDIAIENFHVVHGDRDVSWRIDVGYSDETVQVELRFDRAQYVREVTSRTPQPHRG